MIWLRIGPVEGSCEHGNEPPGSIKYWEILSSCTIGGFSRRVQLHEISQLVSWGLYNDLTEVSGEYFLSFGLDVGILRSHKLITPPFAWNLF
jgi:hypothetical protein